MSRICPLYSGSTGNCTYIIGPSGGLLIDAGGSYKGICNALSSAGGSIEEIKAVLVTHEHTDHIKGLKTLLNKSGIPVMASVNTLEILISEGTVPSGTTTVALDKDIYDFCGIGISRFATSHDCLGSSGYTILMPDNRKISVCTDLGVVTDEVRSALNGSDAVLLESNHDIDMLKKGPYPAELKVRILSDTGHISNNACAAELPRLLKEGTKRFILGHLSQKNNTPLLALSAAESALMDIGAENGTDYILNVAAPNGNRGIVV